VRETQRLHCGSRVPRVAQNLAIFAHNPHTNLVCAAFYAQGDFQVALGGREAGSAVVARLHPSRQEGGVSLVRCFREPTLQVSFPSTQMKHAAHLC
jgi:hypothetical protein